MNTTFISPTKAMIATAFLLCSFIGQVLADSFVGCEMAGHHQHSMQVAANSKHSSQKQDQVYQHAAGTDHHMHQHHVSNSENQSHTHHQAQHTQKNQQLANETSLMDCCGEDCVCPQSACHNLGLFISAVAIPESSTAFSPVLYQSPFNINAISAPLFRPPILS